MKLSEILSRIKSVKPSQFDDAILTGWVSELDGQLHDEVMSQREGAPTLNAPYSQDDDMSVELLVEFPYDQIYVFWLCAMIDFSNQEFDRYSNNMAMYNRYHDSFASKYARDHAQTSTGEISV